MQLKYIKYANENLREYQYHSINELKSILNSSPRSMDINDKQKLFNKSKLVDSVKLNCFGKLQKKKSIILFLIRGMIKSSNYRSVCY